MKLKMIKSSFHKDSFFFAGARFFERVAFYGLRSFLVIYLLNSDLEFSNSEASSIFGLFLSMTYFASILGGLLGDHYGNRKLMFIAVFIQIFGALLFLISSSTIFYFALSIFSIGNGLYIPNLTAQLARANLDRKELLDSTFSFIYFLISFAAIISPYIFYLIYTISSLLAFSTCVVMLLFSLFLISFTDENYPLEKENSVKQNNHWKIIFSFLSVFIFFLFSSLTSTGLSDLFSNLTADLSDASLASLNSKLLVFIFPLIAIVWAYLKMRSLFKYMIGFYFSFMAYLVLATLFSNLDGSNYSTLVFALIFLSIAEILIVPLATSNLVKYVRTINFATIYSLLTLTIPLASFASNSINDFINNDMTIAFNISLMLSLFIFFILGLIFFLKRYKIFQD